MIVDVETAQLFWKCILEPSQKKALAMLKEVCERLLQNLERLPDAKSREILGQGLEWARDHPESIQIHTDRKTARQGHFPNMVAFANLLQGLEGLSQRVGRRVAQITHDKQSEFEKTLAIWHELFSNASPEEVKWAGETYSLQHVPGSAFEVKTDESSPGLQVVDVVLWLYHQFQKGRRLPPGCMAILAYTLENGWESDFSFSGVERAFTQKWQKILDTPLSPEKEKQARQMLAEAEGARQRSMAQYRRDGLPPFMRADNSIEMSESSQQTLPGK
jgi:hypothetical protein